jgi:DNA-binding GntR family transcriptional regulator
MRAAIQSGRLTANDRVPPTRTLAQALGVSRQIIVTAYEELLATGHLRARTGDGSYVAGSEDQCWPRREGRRVFEDPDGHIILVWPLQ